MAELSGWSVRSLQRVVDLLARRRAIGIRIRETYAWINYIARQEPPAAARARLWRTRLQVAIEQRFPDELVSAARGQLADASVLLDMLEEARWDFHTNLLAYADDFARCQTELFRVWRESRSAAVSGPPMEPMPIAPQEEDNRQVEELAVRTGRFLAPGGDGARVRRERAEQLWNRAYGENPWFA